MRTYDERDNRESYYDRDDRRPENGRGYRDSRRNDERDQEPRNRSGRPSPRSGMEPSMDVSEWMVAHRVEIKHITVTIWQRRGRGERPVYSLTLKRTFQSRGGYLTTNKLFADDAPLAAEAFRLAAEWLKPGKSADDIPF